LSIADQLERHVRSHVQDRLEQSRVILVELIRAPLGEITGQLRAGVVVDAWVDQGMSYVSTARSLAPYSLFVDKGTGIYGPIGTRITARGGGALRFYWYNAPTDYGRGKDGFYYFRSVRGMRPQNFFTDPMPAYFREALDSAFVR
jgi:hypothetical protein